MNSSRVENVWQAGVAPTAGLRGLRLPREAPTTKITLSKYR